MGKSLEQVLHRREKWTWIAPTDIFCLPLHTNFTFFSCDLSRILAWQSSHSLWLPVGFSQWSFLTIERKEGGEWSWDILLDPFLTLAISFSQSFLLCKNYSRFSVTFSSSCPFGFRVETTLLWTDWVLLHSIYIFVLSSFDYLTCHLFPVGILIQPIDILKDAQPH